MTTFLTPNHIRHSLANLPILTFEVTDSCNLKCKYCGYGEFYNDYDERKNQNLPFVYASQLLDYLADFWNSNRNISSDRNVYIGFYGGEPLLNMEFVEKVVDYVEKMPMLNTIIGPLVRHGHSCQRLRSVRKVWITVYF